MTLSDGITDVAPGKIAAVVTHLEMRARPALRPAPLRQAYTIEPMEPLSAARYRELFQDTGGPWLWFSRLRLAPAALGEIISHPDVAIFTLRHGGTDVGLLELDFRSPGVGELAFLGMTAPHLGQGAGRMLMNRAIEVAWARPIGVFRVHSCTLDHPAALDFYIRSGFTAVRRQIEIADDPRLTGDLPRNAAPQVPLIAP